MKFLLFLLPLSIDAFTAPTYHFRRVESRLFAERPDASALIQEAMAAAKQFGATSKEARLAWEAVEELSASTRTSDAMALGEDLEECDVEATSAECIEYGAKLDALATLIAETTPQVNRVKNLAAEIKAIKLTPVAMMPTGADSPAIRAALARQGRHG
ncbi:CP12 domain [Fragilaria crotonensis]|nr:CP12 domain [Fragilaria crotonensis]